MRRFDNLNEPTISQRDSSSSSNSRDVNQVGQPNYRTSDYNSRRGTRRPNIEQNTNKNTVLPSTISTKTSTVGGSLPNYTSLDDFPVMPETGTQKTKSHWLEAIKKRDETEKALEPPINQYDSKYWRGVNWIGPMLMRHKTKRIEYSRDGQHWYRTWEDTFSSEQLFRIQCEEEQDEWNRSMAVLDEYCAQCQEESDQYYEDTGQLDDLALAQMRRIEYEEYANQFVYEEEIPDTHIVNQDGSNDYDDYLEDDY